MDYWLTFRAIIKSYIKGCKVCLASKLIRDTPYDKLEFPLVLTHRWKDLSIDHIIGLLISTNCKSKIYDLILVIIYQLIKIVYYKPVKITINVSRVIVINIIIVVWYHDLLDLIISDESSGFTLKFWSSFCYFSGIK